MKAHMLTFMSFKGICSYISPPHALKIKKHEILEMCKITLSKHLIGQLSGFLCLTLRYHVILKIIADIWLANSWQLFLGMSRISVREGLKKIMK